MPQEATKHIHSGTHRYTHATATGLEKHAQAHACTCIGYVVQHTTITCKCQGLEHWHMHDTNSDLSAKIIYTPTKSSNFLRA